MVDGDSGLFIMEIYREKKKIEYFRKFCLLLAYVGTRSFSTAKIGG